MRDANGGAARRRAAVARSAARRWAMGALVVLAVALVPSGGSAEPAPPAPRTLTIVAMNDFHGALYELPDPDAKGRAWGGLPWLAGAIAALRAEAPDLLLLDGGDAFQGAWPVNASRGMGSVEAFHLLGVDAAAVGNHEYDYGGASGGHPLRGALESAARGARFAWLTANVDEVRPEGPVRWSPEGIRPTALVRRGGVTTGLIGLTTTETPSTTRPEYVADLRFRDPVAVVRELAPALRAQGAEVVAVLGHLTGECKEGPQRTPDAPCTPDGEVGRLLTELPEGTVDVIVSGHAHTLMAARVGRTFVAQAWAQGRALVRLDLVVGPSGVDAAASRIAAPWLLAHDAVDPGCGGGAFPLDPLPVGGRTITPSAEAVALVKRLEEAAGGDPCARVACAAAPLVRNRHAESVVGDLLADAMLAAFEGADVAIQNSGGLRADVAAGDIRRSDVQAVMPFDNQSVLLEMTGEKLLLLLRIATSGAHGLPQVAGATYALDPRRTGGSDLDGDGAVADWETDRLCGARVAGRPIDPAQTYEVVVADFLLSGGDHLGPAFVGARELRRGPLLRDLLEAHLRRQQGCIDPARVVDPKAPRITVGACGGAP